MIAASELEVRGNATAEEVAAVLAALRQLTQAQRADQPGTYERWRRARLAAVAHS